MHIENMKQTEAFFRRERVRIAVLDSGLGGLSICAEMERDLRSHLLFIQVSLIYFNVWPEQGRGYNSLESAAERIEVFDRALESVSAFRPDMILIACNTLSVLYHRTLFSSNTRIPVIDIVDFGVDMIYDRLLSTPGSQVLILGTRTTIEEKVHQQKLVQKGIDARRILAQACHGVATEIEKDPKGAAVAQLIGVYMKEAVPKLDNHNMVYVALCCTHFAYSGDLFKEKLSDRLSAEIALLNPNTAMSGFFLANARPRSFATAEVNVELISKIVLDQEKMRSMADAVRNTSETTAAALLDYRFQPNLF
jgi:glutamate racemase